VEQEDAERVVKIVDACLRQVAYDAKTGSLDIDKITTGTSRSGRAIRRELKETIETLIQASDDRVAKVDQIMETMENKYHYKRDEVEHILERMRMDGEVFQPRNGLIKFTAPMR
jgi:replicative DNA helicase Mcm